VSLLRQGKAEVLTIYVGEADQWQGTSVYVALVQFFREHGCAGATVTRAIAGYGAGRRLHQDGVWHLSSDAPMIIQVVDQPERLHRLLPYLDEMVPRGMITTSPVSILLNKHPSSQAR
jgi:PII-like signaling protein